MTIHREFLEAMGFQGFVALAGVLSDPSQVPAKSGIYAILRPHTQPPRFLRHSAAGRFQDLDPSYPIDRLSDKWVPTATVVYIGKAGPAAGRTLRKRINELLRFGNGEPVGHRGGRALWHIPDIWKYSLAWKVCRGTPRDHERMLIAEFENI